MGNWQVCNDKLAKKQHLSWTYYECFRFHNPTCLHVLLWALWTLQWLHCRKTQNPPRRRAWLCPSRCCRCSFRFLRLLFFSHLSRSSPLGDPALFGPKSHLAAKKSMTHTFLNGKVPENWHFSKLGNIKHIVYTSRAGSSERTLGGHPSQESRVWCYLFYFQK